MVNVQSNMQAVKDVREHSHWVLVQRVGTSQAFRSSPRLREFFFYVCNCALREAPEEASEQQIGMHVFGRAPGYNSSEDSIVRTQARGLRQKLADYFANEGLNEPIIIEIPKGHYFPVFEPRSPAPSTEHPEPELQPVRAVGTRRSPWMIVSIVLGVLLLAGVGAWLLQLRSGAPDSTLKQFWTPFLNADNTLVIYSNALFVGDSKRGLRYAPTDSGADTPSPGSLVDTYTGVGELAGVYDLTRLFDKFGSVFHLKRSQLVTWDEARSSNLIFIGSVAENESLRLLPAPMNFTTEAGDGSAGIVNHDPKPGESRLYSRPESTPGHPMTRDYAILSLLQGVQPGRWTLVFSGLTTLGTQSAVEFACHRETLDKLLRIIEKPHGQVRPFEAVLETSIVGGVPLETHLVAIHLR